MISENPNSKLSNNLQAVQKRIELAVSKSKRRSEEVRLIAVTKTVGVETIRELASFGIQDIGENRVQSLLEKKAQIATPLRWHLIGSLQTNKARKSLEHCESIHSVDSLKLLQTLDRIASELGKKAQIFLEVNCSGESSKHGFVPEQVLEVLRESKKLGHLECRGLMTMAPIVSNLEQTRPVFRHLREIRDQAAKENLFSGPGELSMGMSQDFEIAIEEGANWVRIGTALYAGITDGK